MRLPQSSSTVPRLDWLDEAGSTNDVLASLLDADPSIPELTVVATDNQTGGRGRLGRSWTAPAGRCLAVSTLLRADFAGDHGDRAIGWLPLLAGVAVATAVSAELDLLGGTGDVRVKWPNDVRIDGGKVSGVLCERRGQHVIVGTGINLSLREDELPVPTATSLAIAAGTDPDLDRVLASYLRTLRGLYADLCVAGGDPVRSGLRDAVLERTDTVGSDVRVELPDGTVDTGTATGIDADGRLVVDTSAQILVVGAGDVTHLRY